MQLEVTLPVVCIVRDAVREDLPRLVEMGRNFREGSSYDSKLADNPEKMYQLGETLLAQKGLLLMERGGEVVGMLGFLIHSHFISGDIMAGEVFWWVEPSHRRDGVRLLKEMMRRGRAAGAKYIQMVAPNDKVANFYRRMGMSFVESTFQMEL
jgi:RimJ/RimL family protein N-acetyltransferase